MGLNKLRSGQHYDFDGVTYAAARLEWGSDHDLDLVAGLFDQNGQPLRGSMVYFDRLVGGNGAIVLDKDKKTGLGLGKGADETMTFNFTGLPYDVARVDVAAIIQDQPRLNRRNMTFGQARDAQITLLDAHTQRPLAGVDLDASCYGVPAARVVSFTRVGASFRCTASFQTFGSIDALEPVFGG